MQYSTCIRLSFRRNMRIMAELFQRTLLRKPVKKWCEALSSVEQPDCSEGGSRGVGANVWHGGTFGWRAPPIRIHRSQPRNLRQEFERSSVPQSQFAMGRTVRGPPRHLFYLRCPFRFRSLFCKKNETCFGLVFSVKISKMDWDLERTQTTLYPTLA